MEIRNSKLQDTEISISLKKIPGIVFSPQRVAKIYVFIFAHSPLFVFDCPLFAYVSGAQMGTCMSGNVS